MPSVEVVFSVALAFAMVTNASTVTGRLNSDNSKCPSDWVDITNGDDEKCCYGSLLTEGPVPYCCVRDATADFSTGFRARDEIDTTSGLASGTLPNIPTGLPSCATKVPFSASDYSKLVSSASSSIASSGPASNTASQGFATSTGDSSATSSTRTSTNAAMPIMTAESMMCGGAAIAAALLAL